MDRVCNHYHHIDSETVCESIFGAASWLGRLSDDHGFCESLERTVFPSSLKLQFVTLGAFILNNLAANAGFGIHAQDLAPQYITEVIKWAFLGQVLGIMGSAFARMAFIVTLIQLLSPNQKIQLWMLRVFFFFNLTVNTATSLYILLQCKPTYGLWDKTVNPVCLPPDVQEHLGFFQGGQSYSICLAERFSR